MNSLVHQCPKLAKTHWCPRECADVAVRRQALPKGTGVDITSLVKKEFMDEDFVVPERGFETIAMWLRSATLYVKWQIDNPLGEFPNYPKADPTFLFRVIHDFEERAQMGQKKYGERLHAHNGRSAQIDLLQELMDACLYNRQHREDKS
jgi:hypothetical protein